MDETLPAPNHYVATVCHGGERYTAHVEGGDVTLCRGDEWVGTGRWRPGAIEDCGAVLPEGVYEAIEAAIAAAIVASAVVGGADPAPGRPDGDAHVAATTGHADAATWAARAAYTAALADARAAHDAAHEAAHRAEAAAIAAASVAHTAAVVAAWAAWAPRDSRW